jgi:hypothetical protein
MWIKYRHKWAWGISKKWEYEECNPKDLEFVIEDITKRNEWSEKYRGIEYFKVKSLPLEQIRKRINAHRNSMGYHAEQLERFLRMEQNRTKKKNENTKSLLH